MDALTPRQDSAEGHVAPHGVPFVATPSRTSLGDLFNQMQSPDEGVRNAAWEATYEHYWQLVWTRVFYVMRSISWLAEPREIAADVTSDVFVGLPEAVRHYRETGKAEQWLKLIAVRTALRRRGALTGQWSEWVATPGRSFVSYTETAEQIVSRLDEIDSEELIELQRRREALRSSSDKIKRRWDEFLQLYIDGYDFDEIGRRMGLTAATARNWLCKIRKHLSRPFPLTSDV